MKISNFDLHNEALTAAKEHRGIEARLVNLLIEVDARKLYLDLKFTSLYQYVNKGLALSESVSYALMAVSRKAAIIPELKNAIDEGELTLSRAKAMASVVNTKNGAELVEKAKDMTAREFEKEVASLNPKPEKKEKLKPLSAKRSELRANLSDEAAEKLRRILDLEAQAKTKNCTIEEALEVMMDFYLKHKDPVKRAERAKAKARLSLKVPNKPPPNQPSAKSEDSAQPKNQLSTWKIRKRSRVIPAAVKHAVNLRDGHQCTEVGADGARCPNRRWLQTHHKVPLWVGGEHTLENLTTLCSAHHRGQHVFE